MTREEAIEIFKRLKENAPNEMHLETVGSAQELFSMAIQALSQEPCDVSVSEKEPNEISEEVTMRFFKNTLKVRWHDFVIYNVEWLKKNWQMEMDIVCGVKPCDDAISRQAVINAIENDCMKGGLGSCFACYNDAQAFRGEIEKLPSVTQKSGKWIYRRGDKYSCSKCGTTTSVDESGIDEKPMYKFCPYCGAEMVGEKE